MNFLARLGRALAWFENALIALATGLLVLLAGGQIVARVVFETGWLDIEAFLRILVLWLALLGAMVAAREDKHLAIDAASRFTSGLTARLLRIAAYALAAAVSAALAWYSFELVRGEYDAGTVAFGAVPSWATQVIMPVAFAIMAVRFMLHAFAPLPAREGQLP